jgi:hypothetical protein
MEAQRKQFDILMKQNLELVSAIAKSNVAPTGNGTGSTPAQSGRPRACNSANLKECPNCKRMCRHNPADCFSLEANAAKRPTGWKVPAAP